MQGKLVENIPPKLAKENNNSSNHILSHAWFQHFQQPRNNLGTCPFPALHLKRKTSRKVQVLVLKNHLSQYFSQDEKTITKWEMSKLLTYFKSTLKYYKKCYVWNELQTKQSITCIHSIISEKIWNFATYKHIMSINNRFWSIYLYHSNTTPALYGNIANDQHKTTKDIWKDDNTLLFLA